MRRFLVVPLVVLALSSPVLAQDDEESVETQDASPENAVLADLSLGVISLAYERVVDPGVSLQLAVGLYGPWYVVDGVLGAGAELRAFFFLQGSAPFGIYLSPGFRGAWVRAEDDDGARDGGAFSARMSWGYSFDISPVMIRLGAGAQYHLVDIEDPRTGDRQSFSSVFPVVDIYVGFVF